MTRRDRPLKIPEFFLKNVIPYNSFNETQIKMRIVLKKIVFLDKKRDKEFLTIVSLLVLS